MIGLVLRDARGKVLQPQLDRAPSRSSALTMIVGEARHHAADVGNAEAAFPAFLLASPVCGTISGLMTTIGLAVGVRVRRRAAPTNMRMPSCTCGAARPTP